MIRAGTHRRRCPSVLRIRSPRGCRSCARRPPAGSGGASASTVDPDAEIVPTYGSKEAIFSLAQVLGTDGRVVAFGEPAYPVYERGALFAGARVQTLPLRRENGFLPDPRRTGRRRRARLGQLSAQPDRCSRTARVLRRARRGGRAPRLRRRLRRGVHGALVRRAAAVGAAGRRPLAHRRLPDAEQALVDDRLPLGLRRRAAGGRGSAEGVPSDRRAPLLRSSYSAHPSRLERRAPRRGDPRALSREARGADPGDRGPRLGDRGERGDDVPLGASGRTPGALLERGLIVSPGEMFGPSGEGYVRFALVPTLEECERAAEILREIA